MRVRDLKVGMLLYYVGVENIYTVLLNQEEQAQTFQLMTCDKAVPLIDQLSSAINNPKLQRNKLLCILESFVYGWGQELLPPEEYLRIFDVLIIIPQYILHYVPFHLIATENEFLSTAYGITYCSSGTLFSRCVDRNIVRHNNCFDWEFFDDERDPISAPKVPESCISIGVDVLTGKDDGYRKISEQFLHYFPVGYPIFDCQRTHVKDPTDYFKNDAVKSPDVICVVCHGHYDEITSGNSGLLLASTKNYIERSIRLHRGMPYWFRDFPFHYFPVGLSPTPEYAVGIMQAEIMTINELKVDCHTEAQLVALLGCSTGKGHITSGDDFNSLAYQWLKLGGTSVLANFWDADLRFISRWVPLFLENWLTKRQPKAIARQQALKHILNQSPEWVTLEVWGSIVLLGDWL